MTSTETTTAWQAKLEESRQLMRRGWDMEREAESLRCPARLNGSDRCMFDMGHDGDHRLSQWAWLEMPTQ